MLLVALSFAGITVADSLTATFIVAIVLLGLNRDYRNIFIGALTTGLRFIGRAVTGVVRSRTPSTPGTVVRAPSEIQLRPPPFPITVALTFLVAVALGVSALLIALFTDPHNTRITDIFNALMFAFATSLGSLLGLVGGRALR